MSPRSILKQSSDSYSHPNAPKANLLSTALPYPPSPPQVHFPPSPSLTQTYPTHSRTMYDRAPIVVLPNACELPERGCPGRTYDVCSTRPRSATNGRTMHPRAAEEAARKAASSSYSTSMPSSSWGPPPLVPDVSSSESDESDGVVSPPPEYFSNGPGVSMSQYSYAHSVSIVSPSQAQLDKALAFLPYAPSPPQCKDQRKHEKDQKRRSCSSGKYKSEDGARSFAASSLDGCLGGF